MSEPNVEENSLIKKIISITTSVLLVLAIAFFAYVVIQINTNKGRVNVFGYSIYHVVSDSMDPTIPVGGLVVMQERPIQSVKEGDIICFSSLRSQIRGETVTHRVVIREETDGVVALHTRGDNPNTTRDPEVVTSSNFLGVVVSYTGPGSFWITAYRLLTSPIGFFSCIGIPAILLLVVVMRHSIKTITQEVAEIKREAALLAQEEAPMPESEPDFTTESAENTPPVPQELTAQALEELTKKITEEVRQELTQSSQSDPPTKTSE